MAVKVAVVLPDPTVTEAGSVNAVALSDRETTAPLAGASALSETVHVEDPPELRDVGVQLSALRVGGGGAVAVTVPPTPFKGNEFPVGPAPNVFVTSIVVLATPAAIVTLTRAATPFCITLVFKPASRQT